MIAVPKVMSVIEDAKKSTLESSAKMVASAAEKKKVQNQVLGKEENITCENVSKLNDIDYKNCYIEFVENKAYVTILGSNKFEGMNVCKGTKTNSKVVDRCPNERVSVTLELDGETILNNVSGIHKEGDILDLEDPVKENHKFIGWVKESGNGILDDNKFTVGSDNAVIKATWELNVFKLNVELNGGSPAQDFESEYEVGSKITLENPTREGYTFENWSVSGSGASISDNILTMGTEETTITANWRVLSPIEAYSCANGSAGDTALFAYSNDCTILDDGDGNWRIKFLKSGTLTVNSTIVIDAFLVGGGGGKTTTSKGITLTAGSTYTLNIGNGGSGGSTDFGAGSGGTTSGFDLSAAGGGGGGANNSVGGNGGSGIIVIRNARG